MMRDTGLAKETIYSNLERLQKDKMIRSSWKLNPYALGYKVVEVEASIDRSKIRSAVKRLDAHPAVSSIKKCFNDSLRLDIIVRNIEDYKKIEKHLMKMGFKILNFRILTEILYEP